MSHKIAIIKTRDIYTGSDYDESYERIIQSITSWEEVSDAEFKTLQFAAPRLGFMMLEQPINTRSFIDLTIAEYTVIAEAEAARFAEEKKKREDAAFQRKFKKELKDKESKLKMFKKLKEELGNEAS